MLLLLALCVGCGTTKWTDTSRTATEQLLISDAIDRSVSQMDLRALAGKTIYIDTGPLAKVTDKEYLVSAIRQHTLASGGILKEKLEDAEYVLEVRAGAVGTNHHDVLFGVPATTLPSTTYFTAMPSTIPEIPLVKKTEQFAIAKVYVFAYNRTSGRPVWQSGAVPGESKAKDVWVFGAGPFESGTIRNGTRFLPYGSRIPKIPLVDPGAQDPGGTSVSIADEAYFTEPGASEKQIARQPANSVSQTESSSDKGSSETPPSSVVQTGHAAPAKDKPAPAKEPDSMASPTGNSAPIPIPVTDAPPLGESPVSLPFSEAAKSGVVPLPPTEPTPSEPEEESTLSGLLHWPK